MNFTLATSKPSQEAKASDNLRRQGLQVVAPRLRETVVRRGRVVARESYLFPSYLFVSVLGLHVYAMIRSTVGVARVLVEGGEPYHCPDRVMSSLLARMDDEGFVHVELPVVAPPPDFSRGRSVRVQEESHPLFGHVGVSMGMTARQRVRVLMTMLGQKVPVELEHRVLAYA